jgi:perosamine synthetase
MKHISRNTYQSFVEKNIRYLKDKPYGSLVLRGTVGRTRFNLVFLTRECQENARIIHLLTKWRKKHEKWFLAQFPVTDARTKKWFRERLMDDSDRLLFMISVRGTYIGHVGLNRFDFCHETCEIDNIVRGEGGYPGIMESAIKTMMRWGRKKLKIKGYTLSTSSDNERALRLYKRLGFVVTKQMPLVYKKTKGGGEWVTAPKEYSGTIARFDVHMKQKTTTQSRRNPPSRKVTADNLDYNNRAKALLLSPSKHKISFAGPSMTDHEVRYVVDAVKNGWYQTFDKHIRKLEAEMASYVGVKHALATFCATHSLHLACIVCGFQKGDEVIVTDFSWASTAHVIAYTGATPVFVDVKPDTWCIDPKAIEHAITKKTKGIMLVHSFGIPSDMDSIMKIARKYKLKVIEDAAPALGSLYKGKKVGGIGDVGCISFHGAKIAASGEGGMFLTNNKKMYDLAVLKNNLGRTNRLANFWCDTIGYDYQMANVTAALALAQVERIEKLVAMKRKIFNWYWKRLKNIPELQLLKEKPGTRSNYAYPAVLLLTDAISRDELVKRLRDYNIHAREAFPRMSRFPMYRARYANPVAARVEKYGFNLPSAFDTTEKDVEFVCKVLVALVRNA